MKHIQSLNKPLYTHKGGHEQNLGFKTSLKMIRFDAKSHENTFYLLSKDKETEKTLRSQKVVIDTIFLYLIYIEIPQNSWICEEFRYI